MSNTTQLSRRRSITVGVDFDFSRGQRKRIGGRAIKGYEMPGTKKIKFNPAQYMSASALTHKTVHVMAGHVFYSQGDQAKSLYYLESGRAKLIVVSQRGKEATVSRMVAHDFIG